MINWIGGLHRELHYVHSPDIEGGYEPALFILHYEKKGRSFVIPIGAIWKYMDPIHYKGDEVAMRSDWKEFNNIVIKANRVLRGGSPSDLIAVKPNLSDQKEAVETLSACNFAYLLHKSTGIYLCTSYNLARCMQMFEINPTPQAAAQLLLWIQSRLEDLKNMPENPEKEDQYVGGEASVLVDGEKVVTKEMTVSETDLVVHDNA
jgi:hypothetical protein